MREIQLFAACFAIFYLFIPSSAQAKNCPELISNKLNLKVYRCDDGTISFEQPKSKPLSVNPFTLGAEIALMKMVPKKETFPDVDTSEEPISSHPAPGNDKDDQKEDAIESPSKTLKERIREVKESMKVAEGYCGQTAASNVFNAYCNNYLVSPEHLGSKFFKDSSPGVHPSTLTLGLNKLFKNNLNYCQPGHWNYYYSDKKSDYLDSLYHHTQSGASHWSSPSSPVIALISQDEGESLHYVTVVKIENYCPESSRKDVESNKCRIVYNHWGRQDSSSCKDFLQLVEDIHKNKIVKLAIKKFPRIVFKAN